MEKRQRKKKHKRSKKRNWRYGLVFLLGILIMLYPFFSNIYYQVKQDDSIAQFDRQRKKIDVEAIDQRLELARAYNKTLDPGRLSDPYTSLEKKGLSEYARMLELNEQIGYVEVPDIGVKLVMYAGTSANVLEKGAGHLEGTSLPVGGASSHTVITAHTGLPKAKLFTDLVNVKKGALFYIHNIKETLAYQVDRIAVVEPNDFSPILVTEGEDYATLLTCTPYGINSHRLLVRGHRVPYKPPTTKVDKEKDHTIWYVVVAGLVLLLILVLLVLYLKRKCRKKKRADMPA